MRGRESFRLPEGFETLEPFVGRWAVGTSAERVEKRLESDAAQRLSFYSVARDRLQDALSLLDGKPLGELDERERCLMDLMLSLAHVALAVEVQGDQEAIQAQGRRHMRIVGSTADLPA